MTVSTEQILEVFKQSPEPNIKVKHLAKLLDLPVSQRRHLRSALERLMRFGAIQKLRGGRFRLTPVEVEKKEIRKAAEEAVSRTSRVAPRAAHGPKKNQAIGRLITHRDGYGFVELEPDQFSTRPPGFEVEGDIFIPPFQMRDALNGDRVIVEIDAIKRDRRAEGHIVKVLEHKFTSMVGQFHKPGSKPFVAAIDDKFLHKILIDAGGEGGAHDGDIVDVEITRFPSALESPAGRVLEVIGRPGDFGIDVEIVIRKHHLPHRFPSQVQEEARQISQAVSPEEISRREDFRHLPIVTIDGETARDFDDAVYVERLANGNFELQVHIADVAHYVKPHSPLDEEAVLRGTSVYFPNRAVPMLPEELSNGVCSLNPKVDRLVQSCIMEVDGAGQVVRHRFAQGVIRSAERMTYTSVAKVLVDHDAEAMERYANLVERFQMMEELCGILNRMRDARGSIDFDLPEPVVTFDDDGRMTGIVRSERNIAHRLIEEFMLIANETVAQELFNRAIPSLYRVHELPDPMKVAQFEMIARSFGYSLGIDLVVKKFTFDKASRDRAAKSRRPPPGKKSSSVGAVSPYLWAQPTNMVIAPKDYQHLVEKLEGKPEERILSYLMLRSLKQARYSEQNLGHFGLASTCYTHFTSPIRRYPDLIVHRILKKLLADSPADHKMRSRDVKSDTASASSRPLYTTETLAEIGASSSATERRANEAERELMEWKTSKFMQQHIGDELDGLIVGVTKNGFYVELVDLFVEGFVPVGSLFDDFYVFRESLQSLVGDHHKRTFRLGDRLKVLVDRVDDQQHKVHFLVAGMNQRPAVHRRRGKGHH
ncbi:MAG: VacB/RNase II family 3'-5' exoribonuclease [Acidobacteriia bacterium]|nr:VacB/RNase II family 3'-5' exoribonuclease [Terriglobia bacterium]